jgi:hypothetical protein
MLAEVSGDVVEIHSFLREIDAQRHEARFRLAAVAATAAIAFLTSNTIFTELIEPLTRKTTEVSVPMVPAISECVANDSFVHAAECLTAENSGLIAVIGAVLTAAVTGLITWRKLSGDAGHRAGHHGEGPLEHAIHETIVHRAKHGP